METSSLISSRVPAVGSNSMAVSTHQLTLSNLFFNFSKRHSSSTHRTNASNLITEVVKIHNVGWIDSSAVSTWVAFKDVNKLINFSVAPFLLFQMLFFVFEVIIASIKTVTAKALAVFAENLRLITTPTRFHVLDYSANMCKAQGDCR